MISHRDTFLQKIQFFFLVGMKDTMTLDDNSNNLSKYANKHTCIYFCNKSIPQKKIGYQAKITHALKRYQFIQLASQEMKELISCNVPHLRYMTSMSCVLFFFQFCALVVVVEECVDLLMKHC